MLIGIPAILGPDLLYALRVMGHGDEIAIVDGNYPAHEHARRLVRADGHGILALLSAILHVMPVDRSVPQALFRASPDDNPAVRAAIHCQIDDLCALMAPGVSMTPLIGDVLYPRIRAAHTIVASSEPHHYANVILRKGVIDAPGSR